MPLGVNFQWSSVPTDRQSLGGVTPVGKPCLTGVTRLLPHSPRCCSVLRSGGGSGGSHTAEWSAQPGPGVRVRLALSSLEGYAPGVWVELLPDLRNVTHRREGDRTSGGERYPSVQRQEERGALQWSLEVWSGNIGEVCKSNTGTKDPFVQRISCVCFYYLYVSCYSPLFYPMLYSNGIFLV